LDPGRIEQVCLGTLLGRQPGAGALLRGQPLGQLDVPVDGVADEVDGLELRMGHDGECTRGYSAARSMTSRSGLRRVKTRMHAGPVNPATPSPRAAQSPA